MDIRKIESKDINKVSELVANFRVELASFKGIKKKPNVEFGLEEINEYVDNNFPVFIAEEGNVVAGYLVCRVEGDVVWVESLYVSPNYRRSGTASMLYDEAEKLAKSYRNETLYNYVHPNNDKIINFLNKKGYNVLNLIEIRKPWNDEHLSQKINVGNHQFDY